MTGFVQFMEVGGYDLDDDFEVFVLPSNVTHVYEGGPWENTSTICFCGGGTIFVRGSVHEVMQRIQQEEGLKR